MGKENGERITPPNGANAQSYSASAPYTACAQPPLVQTADNFADH